MPLLFNIFLYDTFLTRNLKDYLSYAEDKTPLITVYSIEGVIKSLENDLTNGLPVKQVLSTH